VQVTYFQRKPRPQASNFSIERVFERVRHELAEHIEARVCVAPAYSNGLLRRAWIAWHARRYKGQVNHVTGDTNFTALALPGKRTILTNHDCGYLLRTRGLRRWLLKWIWLTLPVRHVAAVTTVSSYSKDEIVRYAGCAPEKIHVIPNPVNREFQASPKAFNARRPRILHVGTTSNKNLPRLIEAVAGLACTLVIVGPIGDDVRQLLDAARIEHESYVDLTATELLRQYQVCDVVAFASLYEGFGMPILEAQAVGRPLITSDRPPMSETAGEGACLVDPTDSDSIRSALDRIVADASFRSTLIARGFENVKRYQAAAIARQYLAVYEQVLGNVEATLGSVEATAVEVAR
jgi:glycosyltransferase involved in cell wall biosynthesis